VEKRPLCYRDGSAGGVSDVARAANKGIAFPTPRRTGLPRHLKSRISAETIRETRRWGKTRFADGIVMAKTGHEAGRMAMHPYPAPIAGTRLTPRCRPLSAKRCRKSALDIQDGLLTPHWLLGAESLIGITKGQLPHDTWPASPVCYCRTTPAAC
jgi:hypothetical protein